jgi:hypothetical protein
MGLIKQMGGFHVDETAQPYNPMKPPPGRFWVNADISLRWAGLVLLLAVIYGAPLAIVLL